VFLVLATAGCFRAFNVRNYPTSVSLYQAGIERYNAKKYTDAAAAFERLTLDLPSRDSLLPRAHWYLGQSRLKRDERLLAAQAFIRLSESFPNDSLADDALYMSGQAYLGLWPNAALDPQYGLLAQTQFRLLVGIYPDAPMADSAAMALEGLDERFATKDYETGMHYLRRKAYDSAILYFKDVVKGWPESDRARQAMLRMVEIYRLPLLNYTDDAEEVCVTLRAAYPKDGEVVRLCKLPTAMDSVSAPAVRPPKP
jgi:outer membrane protein assembly factor BamD